LFAALLLDCHGFQGYSIRFAAIDAASKPLRKTLPWLRQLDAEL
jgi:hypothetical protein